MIRSYILDPDRKRKSSVNVYWKATRPQKYVLNMSDNKTAYAWDLTSFFKNLKVHIENANVR